MPRLSIAYREAGGVRVTSSGIQADAAGGHVDATWFDEPLPECDKVDGVQNARWPHQDEGVYIHLPEKAVMFELKKGVLSTG